MLLHNCSYSCRLQIHFGQHLSAFCCSSLGVLCTQSHSVIAMAKAAIPACTMAFAVMQQVCPKAYISVWCEHYDLA